MWLNCVHKLDSNCLPRSVTTVDGTPNLAIHPLVKARATHTSVMLTRGKASGHLVNRSTHVKRY